MFILKPRDALAKVLVSKALLWTVMGLLVCILFNLMAGYLHHLKTPETIKHIANVVATLLIVYGVVLEEREIFVRNLAVRLSLGAVPNQEAINDLSEEAGSYLLVTGLVLEVTIQLTDLVNGVFETHYFEQFYIYIYIAMPVTMLSVFLVGHYLYRLRTVP